MQRDTAQCPFPSQNTEGGTHTDSVVDVTYTVPGDEILHAGIIGRVLLVVSSVPSLPKVAHPAQVEQGASCSDSVCTMHH